MKKKFILFLMFMFLPYLVNASEKCTIVSGNGRDIGSEIDCAGEHFYIIEDKEDSVRMLSKYNLYAGKVFDKIVVSEERYSELCNYDWYRSELFEQPEFKGYTQYYSSFKNEDGTYSFFVYKYLDEEVVKQDEKAIGAHGDDKNTPVYPEYGVWTIYLYSFTTENEELWGIPYGNKAFIDYEVHLGYNEYYENETFVFDLMSDYKEYLNDNKIEIVGFDMLSVKDLDKITKEITGNNLPLDEWGLMDWEEKENSKGDEYALVGSLKDLLPKEYEWLWGTTYWTKTFKPYYYSDNSLSYSSSSNLAYFIPTLGYLCNTWGCNGGIGAGIRPVIEIDKASIKYNVVLPEEETKGSIEIVENENENLVSFRVFPKNGYKFEGVTLITESGEKIELTEKDIVVSDDGIMTISEDKFKMGYENVRLEVKWGEDIFNPKTGVKNITGLIFTIMLVLASGLFIIKNYNKSLEI